MLCIIAQIAGDDHRSGEARVDKISMDPFASAVHKAGPFEVSDELSHLRWRLVVPCPSLA